MAALLTENTMKVWALLFSVGLVSANAAQAQTKPDGQWRGNFGAGASYANGAAKSSAFNLAADIERATAADKMVFYGNLLYGKNRSAAGISTTSADQLTAGGRYEWNINEALYAYGMGELGRNKVNDLKLRSTVGAGLGYHLVKKPNATVDVFGGVGYTDNDYYLAADSKGAELQLGEEGAYKLSDTASIKQRVVVYPSLKDSAYTRATADIGLSAAIANGWALNASVGAKFYNAKGAKTETLFLVGVSTKLGAK
jgi:putative salt-induced outer membrane protein